MLNGNQFISQVTQTLNRKLDQEADNLMAEFMKGVHERLPVENGHAHEAFKSAASNVSQGLRKSTELSKTIATFSSSASNDPEATKRGVGTVRRSSGSISITFSINLPFVRKLEYGRNIHVGDLSGNKGPKVNPDSRGQLYSARKPGFGGVLVWQEGGRFRRATVRTGVPSYGFFRNGIQRVKSAAKRK